MALECDSNSPTQGSGVFLYMEKKESGVQEAVSASIKTGKNLGAPREICHSFLNSVRKSTSQIKKPPHRRSASPLNWFPRKKTDSFLNRKIKLLQEVGGMNSSLDETLGDSNPHYCRVEREKIAAREAAGKAMEAHKAALVEASWCRILRAARIPNKEAETQLETAEKNVKKVFEEAAAMGVIMYDRPDCPRGPCEVETLPKTGGGSTHTVTASFQTAFEVDKEVAAAVKTAFIQLANGTTSNKNEFRNLLWKISQNPDCDVEVSNLISQAESDAGPESESNLDKKCKMPDIGVKKKSSGSSDKLVDIMHDRLKSMQEDELASLATIVATCGLNAALHEEESSRHEPDSTVAYYADSHTKRKQAITEVPSLEKCLVKHVSRLEREIQEARERRKSSRKKENEGSVEGSSELILGDAQNTTTLPDTNQDLGSILVKHTSRLEKEVEKAKKLQEAWGRLVEPQDMPIQEAKQCEVSRCTNGSTDYQESCKENINSNKLSNDTDEEPDRFVKEAVACARLPPCENSNLIRSLSRIERAKLETLEAFSVQGTLDNVMVKHISRLEREKMALPEKRGMAKERIKKQETSVIDSLDKVLVKHVSRLEKEKMSAPMVEEWMKKKDRPVETSRGSLGDILVKHQSRRETEKSFTAQQSEDHVKRPQTRREAREKEILEAWGGLSLANSVKPHLSRLERDKAAWKRAEEEQRQAMA